MTFDPRPAIALGLLVAATACIPQKRIEITSEPVGAMVNLEGYPAGTTPFARLMSWRTGREDDVIHATIKRDGYADGKLDLRWLPVEQTTFHVDLQRLERAPAAGPRPPSPDERGSVDEERLIRIERLLEKLRDQPPATPPPESFSFLENLERLKKLRDAGVLTDAEFEAGKKRLLEPKAAAPSESPSPR